MNHPNISHIKEKVTRMIWINDNIDSNSPIRIKVICKYRVCGRYIDVVTMVYVNYSPSLLALVQ